MLHMIASATKWGHIKPGDYVRDSAEVAWYVEAFDVDRGYLLKGRDGSRKIVKPWLGGDVVKLEPSHEEAVATVERMLGAQVLWMHGPKGPKTCPRLGAVIKDHQDHLLWMHGIYLKSGKGSKSIKYLAEVHADEHAKDNGGPMNAHNYSFHLHA